MKRTALAIILAALAPLAFGQADDTGALPTRTPDRSTTCTLGALNAACTVALEGRSSIGLQISTTNLNATLLPYASYDGGVTWVNSYFLFDAFSFAAAFSGAIFTGGVATKQYEFHGPSGATHARIQVSAYSSGSATARVTATSAAPQLSRVIGGNTEGNMSYAAPVEVGGYDIDGIIRTLRTDPSGRPEITPAQRVSANNDGACISVTASTTVLASFATRKGFSLFARETNTDVVYVKMGATATSADFPLPAGSAYNMQAGVVYTGVIDAIAASGTQSVCVVEF